jgi:vesicle-associated membrane protein 4
MAAEHTAPYDPYIPSGGAQHAGGAQGGSNNRTAALQAVCHFSESVHLSPL